MFQEFLDYLIYIYQNLFPLMTLKYAILIVTSFVAIWFVGFLFATLFFEFTIKKSVIISLIAAIAAVIEVLWSDCFRNRIEENLILFLIGGIVITKYAIKLLNRHYSHKIDTKDICDDYPVKKTELRQYEAKNEKNE